MNLRRFPPPLWLSLLIAGALATSSPAEEITLHVAPDGDDRWTGASPEATGQADGPLASLQGARDRVRALRRDGNGHHDHVNILMAPGVYPLIEPVVFEPIDGRATYRAEAGGEVVFDGGRTIEGFRETPDGLWTTNVPGVAEGEWTIEQLYVNGRRATRARTPNEFYHYMLKRAPKDAKIGEGGGSPANRAFVARPEDLKPLEGLSPQQLNDANIVVYHSWEVSRHRIESVDFQTGLVVLTGPAPWPFLQWGPNQRYHVENVPKALDEPGEWFLDRDGTLTYKPLSGEMIDEARVVAPVADSFLAIEGDPDNQALVEDLSFEGLTFRHSRHSLPPEGDANSQAASSIPAVVMVDGARNVNLKNCRIEHVGVYGIWFRRGATDCRVERCALVDLGAGGVRIGEMRIPDRPEWATGKITVDDCIIREGGRWFPGAVGVWIGQSSDNAITHNDIGDLFYTAVSVGWTWGYGPSASQRNTIEYNRLHHIGRGVLSDMGGVYTLGISDGTSVSHNVIHDVDSYNKEGAGGWGLYNDEGSTRIKLENNVVWNTSTGSYHQHYGRENILRNNIFAFSRNGQIARTRLEDHLSFTIERTIVYWDGGPLLTGNWSGGNFRLDHNLYYESGGEPVLFNGQSLEDWREATGQDEHSKVADPLFEDAEAFDFRLKEGSPALGVGFEPFDYSKAGVRSGGAWAEEASAPIAPTRFAPEPPPMTVREDFEAIAPGDRPDGASFSDEGRPELISVTEEAAFGGRRSLKLTDVEGLKQGFDPHFYYQPRYQEGLATCSFALRPQPGALFYHEWRDAASPYRVGPSLWLRDGKLWVGDREVALIPPGDWTRIKIESRLDNSSEEATWSLTIEKAGEPPVKLAGLPTARGWKSVDWIGFVSSAEHSTAVYLDDLELSNRP